MDEIFRPGAPLSALQLYELSRDGLTVQLTDSAWVPAGAHISPAVRAAALGLPPLAGTAYSHTSAHWLWWGQGVAPGVRTVTTLKRRRVRCVPELTEVYERSLHEGEWEGLGHVRVTTPAKTLFDVLSHALATLADPAQLRRRAVEVLAPAAPADRQALMDYADAAFRRPGITRVRELILSIDPRAVSSVTRRLSR